MRAIHVASGLLLLGGCLLGGPLVARAAPEGALPVLQDAQPLAVGLPLGRRIWTARVDVPAGSGRLGLLVSGDRNVDLYLHDGARPKGDLAQSADASSVTPSPHETLTLDTGASPGLRAGTWFVTVENPDASSSAVAFEIVAYVDRRGGPRTLLPGGPTPVTLTSTRRGDAFRTYLPRRARSADVDLVPAVAGGVRFKVQGPDRFVRTGASRTGRIVLDAQDAPPGGYVVTISPSRRIARPLAPTARLTLSFPGGWVLPQPPNPLLEVDQPRPFLLGGPRHGSVQRVRVPVREGQRGFALEAANGLGLDVDIYVRRGAAPRRQDEDADWLALSTSPVERIVVGGERPLPAGTYHAEIVLLDRENPVEVVVTLKELEDGAYAWGKGEAPPALPPDTWVDGSVEVGRSAASWHAIEVPAGTKRFHAQLLGASGPLELLLVRPSDGSIVARSFTALVDESLRAAFPKPPTKPTRFFLGVLNRATWDPLVRYRLAAALEQRPTLPDDLAWPPVHARADATPAERAAAASVEITIGDCSGGSGACVSPRGWVISCRHCLQRTDGTGRLQRDRIIVAFPQTFDRPPVQTFFAEIRAEDKARDLVLLTPIRDVFGRPIPAEVTFPHLPLGEPSDVRIGQELYVGGYPQMGSDCTRTAVVLSHGIVSGLERRPDGPAWIKTDAWVAPGHSGGPVVDAKGRLVGIAAATLGCTESLGLCVPVDRIPAAWRAWLAEQTEGGPRNPDPAD